MSELIVQLYQEMADHTKPECGKCRVPNSCCDANYCDMARAYAQFRGVDLTSLYKNHQKVPFLHDNQCVVPPHLRPICTLHTCEINAIGSKVGDQAWTDRYFEIRDKIDEEEERQETNGEFAGAP